MYGMYNINTLSLNHTDMYKELLESNIKISIDMRWALWHLPLLQINTSTCFIPAFSVMCIADIFRHPSFDMLNKQDGSKSTNHSPLT